MEEMGTSAEAVRKDEEARKKKGLPAEDAWFWHPYVMLPKASHNANIYLLQDDVPNFLRFLTNSYAAMVAADGKMWEAWHLGNYDPCSAPDNGTAGWFMENFRDLLVMEEGRSLWVARAIPRAWLEQGKKIRRPQCPDLLRPAGVRNRLRRRPRPDYGDRRDALADSAADRAGAISPSAAEADQERDGQRQGMERFRSGQGSRALARRAGVGQSGSGLLSCRRSCLLRTRL